MNRYAKIRKEFNSLDEATRAQVNKDHTVRWFVQGTTGEMIPAKPGDKDNGTWQFKCKCGFVSDEVSPRERLHEASLLHRFNVATGTSFLIGTPFQVAQPVAPAKAQRPAKPAA